MIASIIFLCYTLIVSRNRDQEMIHSLHYITLHYIILYYIILYYIILYGGLYVSKQTR